MKSTFHVAIIMDGNGRWAEARGLPRIAGHRAGADAVRKTVEAAPEFGIDVLSLYAFSADNWRRPESEVTALFRLLRAYLLKETARCLKNGVRISAIGRRDRLPAALVALIEQAERATSRCRKLHLRIALDYSSREEILAAARQCSPRELTREAISRRLGPDVDLLIRTSGEQRLSDFLLWECAYAEFLFTPKSWPEFDRNTLCAAVAEYQARDRRFGGLARARRSA
jgi:undecaprenyl diphosphate synthase